MSNANSESLIIIVRHGERCDKVGLEPTFHKNDPELTENGKKQAFILGEILSDFLFKNFPQVSKIKINSSPFARTIQTSVNLIKGLKKNHTLEDKIHLNYSLGELIIKDFYEHYSIDKYLIVKNEKEKIEKEIADIELTFTNEFEDLNIIEYESGEDCQKRILNGVINLYNLSNDENNIDKENSDKIVNIIISHAGPIELLNSSLDYPGEQGWEFIKYCQCYIYNFKNIDEHEDDNKENIKYEFLDTFHPEQ